MTAEEKRRFNEQVRHTQIRSSRVYTFFIVLASNLFLFADYEFLPAHFSELLLMRLGLTLIELGLLYAIGFARVSHAFLILSAGLMIYHVGIVYIGVLAAEAGLYTYQQGTVIVLVYCCTLLQAPMRHSTVVVLFSWLTYTLSIGLFTDTPYIIMLNNFLVFGTVAFMGLMTVAHRERYLLAFFLKSNELNEQKQQASQQALTDALTELPNRFALMRKLESYRGRVPKDMLVMMLDVDNFKLLNDQFGHHAGDMALKLIAARLQEIYQNEDQAFLARYGGEEFILLYEEAEDGRSRHLAEQAIQAVSALQHPTLPPLTLSAGAYVTRTAETSISECIERADTALLAAKAEGKNRVIFAT